MSVGSGRGRGLVRPDFAGGDFGASLVDGVDLGAEVALAAAVRLGRGEGGGSGESAAVAAARSSVRSSSTLRYLRR